MSFTVNDGVEHFAPESFSDQVFGFRREWFVEPR
jgi:hypothetical protein